MTGTAASSAGTPAAHQGALPYLRNAVETWTDCTQTLDAGAIVLSGRCGRCHGSTTRKLEITVQGAAETDKMAEKAERFVVECECQHLHTGKPEKSAVGCGAYWWASPTDGAQQ